MKSKNVKNKKGKGKPKEAPILKRKQLRKEKRLAKKKTKKEYIASKYKKGIIQQLPKVEHKETVDEDEEITSSEDEEVTPVKKQDIKKEKVKTQEVKKVETNRKTEKELKELKRQQKKQRKLQLKVANEEEERNIKMLEKQLGLKKRKSKNLPKAFADDGLDFLLDAVDPEKLKNLGDISDSDDEFSSKKFKMDDINDNSDNSEEDDDFANEVLGDMDESHDSEMSEDEEEEDYMDDADSTVEDNENSDDIESDCDEPTENLPKPEKPDRWEDIYGRLRDKDGNVVDEKSETKSENVENCKMSSKYIPPALRRAMDTGDDQKKRIALQRLNKQVKGLLNRLAESNMHGIANQMEELYRDNSRNDMNQTLTDILMSSLVADSLTPSRLVMEHAMLVAILHANVGTEVGAHVLQLFVKQFDSSYMDLDLVNVDNKRLDNVALLVSYIYNFNIVDAKLIFDILDKLVDSFKPKDIEIVLLVLKNVGFVIRKDDPSSLKDLILKIQSKASSAGSDSDLDDSRVKFMLEILMAIKNNNVNKIPNYDPSHFEHLKKTLKSFVREGNYVTEMKVGLNDLLKADERGRWWIVGSAFTGFLPGEKGDHGKDDVEKESKERFSSKLLDLARKMRMNTDVRKNIFCIVMSAEDYLDAFEKLVKLGTKNQNEREVIFVLVDCCVQEKNFNPYYPKLISKLATFDRKYRLAAQFTIWDKLKQIDDLKRIQVKNLGQLTCHLIKEKSQPLSVLKVIQFSEMNKRNVAYLREVLLGILMQKNADHLVEAFKAVAESPKLHLFREGLRLFMQHFLIKQSSKLSESVDKELMKKRIRLSESALLTAGSSLKL